MKKLKNKFCWVIWLGCVCLVVSVGYAEFVWEKKTQRYQATWDETKIEIPFSFENKGKKPIRIVSLAASCGCVTLDKGIQKVIKPKHKGEVKATYEVGSRTGTQIATIYVETDERKGKVYTLQIVLDLPQAAQMVPGVLSWKRGGNVEAKIMRIRWLGDGRAQIGENIQAPAGWNIHFSEAVPGKEWEMRAYPESSKEEVIHQVPLVFKVGGGERRSEAILLIHD